MALLLTILIFAFVSLCHGQVQEVDVIIMGAGMTGISAGHVFANRSMTNFIIIEAQDYIGGRTRTTPFGSKNIGINIGGSWISGACYNVTTSQCWFDDTPPTAINPMLTLALQYNMSFARTDIHEWNQPYAPYINGTNINDVISNLLVTAEYDKWDTVQRCMNVLIWEIYLGIIEDMSYYEGLDRCLWRPPLNLIENTIQWVEFDLEFASDIKASSLGNSELESYYLYGNQDLLVTDPTGYAGITIRQAGDYLNLNDLDNDPKIALNSPIDLIEYDKEGGVTVHIKDSSKQYHAKYGLVTFGIGVLQSNIVRFSPILPQWKRQAITQTMMAHYAAVYIEWPYNFWSDLHPEIDRNNLVIMVDARYGYFPWFINFNHPSLLPGSLLWRFDVTDTLAVQLQNQPIEQTITQLMNDKFANYFDIEKIPQPLNVFVGNWSINPYTQGAYSSFPVGYDWDKEVVNLQWAADEVLYFNGEATAEDSGYVHAAYLEGIRAANMILNCLGYSDTNGYECEGPYQQRFNSTNNHPKRYDRMKRRQNNKYKQMRRPIAY